MTGPRALVVAIALATGATPPPANAQTATDLVNQGVRAYGILEFDAAAAFLQSALRAAPREGLAPADAARALTYLAAAEFYRGEPDSTAEVFRRLVLLDTRTRPDELVFPPEITNIFEAVRRDTKALTVVAPDTAELLAGQDEIAFVLHASSFMGAAAEVTRPNGARVLLLYDGPVNDSLTVRWNGLDSLSRRLPDGAYVLTVTSRRPGGTDLRSHRFPLTLHAVLRDTLLHPGRPDSSLLLPERVSPARSLEGLVGGALVGTAVMVLPRILSSNAELAGTRFVVGGAVTLAGIASFVVRRPGRELPDNVAANEALLRNWRDRLDAVLAENRRRNADVRLVIGVGTPTIVGAGTP